MTKSAPAQDNGPGRVPAEEKPDEQWRQYKEERGRNRKDVAATAIANDDRGNSDGDGAAASAAASAADHDDHDDRDRDRDDDDDDEDDDDDKDDDRDGHVEELAVASDDGSVRIYSIRTQ